MMAFPCQVCRTQLSADEAQVGQAVRCPKCMSVIHVPTPEMVGAAVASAVALTRPPPSVHLDTTRYTGLPAGEGRRFGFNCGYCSSRLEATQGVSGHDGQCPTCGSTITIPILDRYGRLIDPKSGQIIKQDPHPVHAYAAAGERAPKIIHGDGGLQIQCPRCAAASPITSNNCRSCGMPFTMEGTTLEASGSSNGFCVASLVLGILGIPAFCAVIPPVLAIVFGIIGYMQASRQGSTGGGKGMAIAGMVCGGIGCMLLAAWIFQ